MDKAGGGSGANHPNMIGSILTILTNMSLNDQNNVKIRLHGAHIIGGILMDHCTTFNTQNPKKYVRPPEVVFSSFTRVLSCLV
jgi:hypothetical protein